jgi:hypothetical protein
LIRWRRSLPRAKGRGDLFFAGPGRWKKVLGHCEIAKRYQVQIDGSEVKCHDEIVSVKSKKRDTSVSATNPIDFVSIAGLVQLKKLNRLLKVTTIDCEGLLRICPGWRRHLIKPPKLGFVFCFFKLSTRNKVRDII